MKGFTTWLKDTALDLLDDLKRAHKSLTIWFNGSLAAGPEVIAYLATEMPKMEAYVMPEHYRRTMQVLLICNMMLRFKTKRALRDK